MLLDSTPMLLAFGPYYWEFPAAQSPFGTPLSGSKPIRFEIGLALFH